MKKLDLQQIKDFQLKIMDEIDAYCKKKGLRYFLVGGTLIGAVRHNGYIPWDDDIDIAMPRKDYEKLLNEFVSQTGDVTILDNSKDKKYYWASAKAIHNGTILTENGSKYTIGVFVDIFPLDNTSGDKEICIEKIKKASVWKNILTLKHLTFKKDRALHKNMLVALGRVFCFLSDRWIIKKINRIAQADKNKVDCKYVCSFLGAWGTKEVFEAKWFEKTIPHQFEDRMYEIPYEYDKYLKKLYGDYMTLPPVEKRVTHHNYTAYMK